VLEERAVAYVFADRVFVRPQLPGHRFLMTATGAARASPSADHVRPRISGIFNVEK
jgi:hypothetical protein